MTKPKPCKLGESDRRKAARKAWKARQKSRTRAKGIDSVSNSIGALPPPPPPGSAVAEKCMESWMDAYNDAKSLEDCQKIIVAVKAQYVLVKAMPPSPQRDQLLIDMAKFIAQQEDMARKLKIALDLQTQAYLDCIGGSWV